MTMTQFHQKLREKDGVVYNWPLIMQTNVNTTKEIMQIAPIPAYLVYDGLHADIDAANIIE